MTVNGQCIWVWNSPTMVSGPFSPSNYAVMLIDWYKMLLSVDQPTHIPQNHQFYRSCICWFSKLNSRYLELLIKLYEKGPPYLWDSYCHCLFLWSRSKLAVNPCTRNQGKGTPERDVLNHGTSPVS